MGGQWPELLIGILAFSTVNFPGQLQRAHIVAVMNTRNWLFPSNTENTSKIYVVSQAELCPAGLFWTSLIPYKHNEDKVEVLPFITLYPKPQDF